MLTLLNDAETKKTYPESSEGNVFFFFRMFDAANNKKLILQIALFQKKKPLLLEQDQIIRLKETSSNDQNRTSIESGFLLFSGPL